MSIALPLKMRVYGSSITSRATGMEGTANGMIIADRGGMTISDIVKASGSSAVVIADCGPHCAASFDNHGSTVGRLLVGPIVKVWF